MGSATSKPKQPKSGETRLSNHLSTDITEHKSDDATNTTEERTVLDDSFDTDITVKNCNKNLELYNSASKPITSECEGKNSISSNKCTELQDKVTGNQNDRRACEIIFRGLKGHSENESDAEPEILSSHSQFSNSADIQEDCNEISNVEGIANIPPFSTKMARDQCTENDRTQNNAITGSENDKLQNDVINLETKIEDELPQTNDLNGNSSKEKEEKHVLKSKFDEHLIPTAFEKYKPLIQKELFLLHPSPNVLESAQNSILGRKDCDVPRFNDGMPLPIPYRWDISYDDHTNGTKMCSSIPLANFESRLKQEVTSYDKLRLIFDVVTSFTSREQIEIDAKHLGIHIKDEETDIYVEIFQYLCSVVSIPCMTIHGYLRTIPKEKKVDWSVVSQWLAVLYENKWMLIDPHPVDKKLWESKNCIMIGSSFRKINTVDFLFRKQMDKHFLVNPTEFVYYCFPNKSYWQLLWRPVNYEEWQNMVFLTPFFYDLKLTLKTSHTFHVDMTSNSLKTFKISFPSNKKIQFAARFCSYSGDCLDTPEKSWTFVDTDVDKSETAVKLKTAQNGVLKIYAMDTESSSIYVMVCCFDILASFDNKNIPDCKDVCGFPRNVLRFEWGPGVDTSICGLVPLSHRDSEITTSDSSVLIKFKRTKDDYMYDFSIDTTSTSDEPISRRFVFFWYDTDSITYRISSPFKGLVLFNILKKETILLSHNASVCSYLIHFLNEPSCNCMPPLVEDGKLGITKDGRRERIRFTDCVNGIIKSTSSGEVTLRLQNYSGGHIEPRLHIITSCFHNMIRHVFITYNASLIIIRINLPRKGEYLLSLFSGAGETDSKCLYNGLVSVTNPSLRWSPYPELCLDHINNIGVFSPKSGILSAKTDIYFSIEIPDSVDVAAVSCKGWTHLEETSKHVWEGLVTTGYAGTDVRIMARFEIGSNEFLRLLTYKVISAEEIETKTKHQQLLVKNAGYILENDEMLKSLLDKV
ncbi:uncharacterized protein LOC127717920 isoform X1 [Mytilus californianus]|uniref:uncharacterized protein LOC127717920 isoform X1 n=2 Tax=Mytilus californianus TaxID=6549 RepID=UPI002245D458|nr:uncharacterized protein LOC127717920 isoform X1 [Mytilus californianus]